MPTWPHVLDGDILYSLLWYKCHTSVLMFFIVKIIHIYCSSNHQQHFLGYGIYSECNCVKYPMEANWLLEHHPSLQASLY